MENDKLPEKALRGLANEELYDQVKVKAAIGAICGAISELTVVEAYNALKSVYVSFCETYTKQEED